MDQLKNFGDERQTAFCLYCGRISPDTRDHVPPKVFLDKPYPANLQVVGACDPCNQRYSLDEEYVACLVECVRVGGVNGDVIEREKVRRLLTEKPALASRLNQARVEANGTIFFNIEPERVTNVLLKLVRGHALYEQNEPRFDEPVNFSFGPLCTLADQLRQQFDTPPQAVLWPEVGSRAMQRMVIAGNQSLTEWIIVQPGRYRYLTSVAESLTVRIVLSEYLWCEAAW